MRHILRAEVQRTCHCQEEGLDGTKHGHPQPRTFQCTVGYKQILQPCSNHVTNYETSTIFDEVEVERII